MKKYRYFIDYLDRTNVNFIGDFMTTHNCSVNQWENPLGLKGMTFVEFASEDVDSLKNGFLRMGFAFLGTHKQKKNITLFGQNEIYFVVNNEPDQFAKEFEKFHGPCACATGFCVENAEKAFEVAIQRGAKPCKDPLSHSFPAIYGIGDSVVYFIEDDPQVFYKKHFNLNISSHSGFNLSILDHLTNNVQKNKMDEWCEFYKKIFNFREVRYFDIEGEQTGLVSKVMRSPCNEITIPINEPKDSKSQIQEYIEEYKGAGIQHIALLTDDIINSVSQLKERGVEFLDVPDTYYEDLPKRLSNIDEDIEDLKKLKILADGDEEGYLLQIFTKNRIGPIFFEIIQRKNHDGFGEGNFQALFDAIERDQRERGYLK